MRGRMAIFNEWVREIADRHGASVVDMWRMRDIEIDRRDGHRPDAPQQAGHTHMAHAVLDGLGVEHGLDPVTVGPLPVLGRRETWAANAQWTREFLVPWVHRRLTGRSSGDTISPQASGTRALGVAGRRLLPPR